MSSLARWTYTNTATVRPFQSEDLYNGGILYGEPFDIACTWEVGGKMIRAANGDEFVSRYVVYTEDPRVSYRDQITLAGIEAPETVRDVRQWDMSPFGEADSPDFKVVT